MNAPHVQSKVGRLLFVIEAPKKVPRLKQVLARLNVPAFEVIATQGKLFDIQEGHGISEDGQLASWAPISDERIEFIQNKIQSAKRVIIATDNDPEGEVIAAHVAALAQGKKMARMALGELTESAVEKAMQSLKSIDRKRVENTVVRRVLDRWIGYALPETLENPNVSLGRVSTPLLADIERYPLRRHATRWALGREQTTVHSVTPMDYVEVQATHNQIQQAAQGIESETVSMDLRPWSGPELIKTVLERTEADLNEVSQAVQSLYEQGRISYPRTSDQHFSQERAQALKAMSDHFGISRLSQARLAVISAADEALGHGAVMHTDLSRVDPKKSIRECASLEEQIETLIAKRCVLVASDVILEVEHKALTVGAKRVTLETTRGQVPVWAREALGNDEGFYALKLDASKGIERTVKSKAHAIFERGVELGVGSPSTLIGAAQKTSRWVTQDGELSKMGRESLQAARILVPALQEPEFAQALNEVLLSNVELEPEALFAEVLSQLVEDALDEQTRDMAARLIDQIDKRAMAPAPTSPKTAPSDGFDLNSF